MKQEIANAQTGIMCTQVISIIVPAFNEASSIERFLKSLRERTGDAEIIIVDGGSSDDTFELARNRCDQCLRSARGRALQMNTGAAAASGDIFWFLHGVSTGGAAVIRIRRVAVGWPSHHAIHRRARNRSGRKIIRLVRRRLPNRQ